MTTVLITGSREWKDIEIIRKVIKDIGMIALLIHGDCRGADKLAGKVAMESKIPISIHPYKQELGLRGGPIRNQEMVNLLKKQDGKKIVLAFHDDLTRSKGTKNCIKLALKAGLSVLFIDSKGSVQSLTTI